MKYFSNFCFLFTIICFENVQAFASKSLDPQKETNIYFYYGVNNTRHSKFPLSNALALLDDINFSKNKKTTLYLHGYTESQKGTSIPSVKYAYSFRQDHNFVTLDYNAFVNGSYITAVLNVPYLAPYFARALIKLFEAGLSLDSFHLVGHSLGGQLAGSIGRKIQELTNGKTILRRITALDPAGPLFYLLPLSSHLNRKDAQMVDVIHTDPKVYGTPLQCGTVDFWPNYRAVLQPGCPKRTLGTMDANDFCNHWRSWQFWAESVEGNEGKAFLAHKARSYREFLLRPENSSSTTERALMGIDTSPRSTGNFYLRTNANQPYAKAVITYLPRNGTESQSV